MKAIEITTKTDKYGNLKINYPMNKKESNVRVIMSILANVYSDYGVKCTIQKGINL